MNMLKSVLAAGAFALVSAGASEAVEVSVTADLILVEVTVTVTVCGSAGGVTVCDADHLTLAV